MVNLSVELEPEIPALFDGIASDVKKLISDLTKEIAAESKTRIIKRGRPSVAGESPSFQTGNLVALIETKISDFEGEIIFNAPYSGILEFKRDRPFVEISIDTVLEKTMPQL